MDHTYVEEQGLIELYHQGALPPEEEARFEEHFVDCPRCTAELEAARGFQAGIRQMAAEEAAQAQAAVQVAAQIGILAGLARWLSRPTTAALFTGGVAALILATVWLGLEAGRLRSTAELAKAEAGDWQERFESERRSVAELERRLAEAEAGDVPNTSDLDELRARLEEATTALESSARELERLKQPRGNIPVFILSVVRSHDQPAAVIDLSEIGNWLSLAVDVDRDPRIESYQVEISGGPNQDLWRLDNLQPNAFETLMITLPASDLPRGDYRFEVKGLLTPGDTIDVDRFVFKVIDGD